MMGMIAGGDVGTTAGGILAVGVETGGVATDGTVVPDTEGSDTTGGVVAVGAGGTVPNSGATRPVPPTV